MSEPTDPNATAARDPNISSASSADETAPMASGKPKFGPPAESGEVGTLGPYRVVKQLGAGGMGAVYLALDTRLDRKLALKVMLPEFAANREAKERFLREAKSAAKITHDNVVTVFEADERDGVPYIAMQFLQGYPLDEYLKNKGAPPLAHVIRIVREAALGLSAAHDLGLVHRDIKPGNLWLEAPNGRVKVLDFGLAKPVGSETELTSTGAVVGTPAYMSPEQARGVKIDARTDLFSLGALLYRLCTGRTPFNGPNVMAVLMALGSDDPTPVRELNPNVPEPLAALIHQLLSKKPEHRPQTAAEVAKRLQGILAQVLNPGAVAPPGPVPTASAADLSVSQPVVVHALPLQPPNVAPMHVTAAPESAFAGLGEDPDGDDATQAEAPAPRREPKPREPKTGGKGVLIGAGVAVLLALGAVALIVPQLMKGPKQPTADGTPSDAPAPPDANKGTKGAGPSPKPPPVAKPTDLPPLPPFEWKPVAAGASPFDKLDANAIPKEERFVPLPKEVVAVIGSHVRKHWSGAIADVVISPDGKWVATCGFTSWSNTSQILFVWNLATRTLHSVVPPLPDAVFLSVTFAPDARTLYVTTNKGLVLYPFLAEKPAFAPWPGYEGKGGLFGPGESLGATFAPDGKVLVLGSFDTNGPLQVWDNTTSPPRKVKDVERGGVPLGFSADRAAVLTARRDADGAPLRLTSIPLAKDGAPKVLLALPPDARLYRDGFPPSVGLSPDGKSLAAMDKILGGDAGTLYDLTADPPKETRFRFPDVVQGGVQFLSDGKTLARRDSDATYLLAPTQAPPVMRRIPTGSYVYPWGFAFAADGKTLVAGRGVEVCFWDLSGAEPKELDPLPPGVAYSSPYQDSAPVVASERGLVGVARPDGVAFRGQFWDSTGLQPKPWPNADVWVGGAPHRAALVTLTRDGGHAAVDREDGTQPLRLTETGVKEGRKADARAFRGNFRDGRGVVHAADGAGLLWDIREPFDKAKPLPGVFTGRQEPSAVRDDGRLLAAWRQHTDGRTSGSVALWNLTADKPTLVTTLEGNYAQHARAFSPDGRYLALPTAHDYPDGVHVYDLSGKAPRRLPDLPTRTKDVCTAAFTPDAKRLATVTLAGHLEVFDAATQARVWEAKLPGAAYWVEFAHDGRHLFTHNSNGTVYVLRLNDLGGDADRKAAEWAISNGGSVWVRVGADQWQVSESKNLPAGSFRVFILVAANGGAPAARVTDADLERLQELTDLEHLSLSFGAVTDAGLPLLKRLTKLITLQLHKTRVTDAGLSHLKPLASLQVLELSETPVTDAGLADLAEMRQLTRLILTGTKATAAGVQKLAKALPNCTIEWDGGKIEPKK